VEYEIGMPLRLKAIDSQNPQTVALVRGPLALFAVGTVPPTFSRGQLLAASTLAATSEDWIVQGDAGKVTFRPFLAVKDETYRLYLQATG
jgi:hypothetical protein